MGDLIGKALEKGIEAAIEPAKKFVELLAGPGAEEIGLGFGDRARFRRFKNQVRMLAKAEQFVKDAGFTPRAVPIKTLFPLLNGASLEEDEDMQERWAALLANAANADGEVEVKPTFVEILKQLSASEAKLLDVIFSEVCSRLPHDTTIRVKLYASSGVEFWLEALRRLAAWSPESSLTLALSILESHGLAERQRRLGMDSRDQLTTRSEEGLAYFREHEFSYHLTPLGYEFVSACRRPKRKEGERG